MYNQVYTTAHRPNSRNACPVCESKKAATKCFWREDVSGHWVMAYCATPSDKTATNSVVPGMYLHVNNGNQGYSAEMKELNRKIAAEKQAQAQAKELTPVQIDAINRHFLACCQLEDRHREYLQNEGIPTTGIKSFRYSTASALANELLAQFPTTAPKHHLIKEIEGKDGRKWFTIAAAAADGMLFPATDIDGLILGIQIRKDMPKGKDDRYRWLSHDNRGGTPLTVFKASTNTQFTNILIITEGYKKAAAAAEFWGCNAISVQGVNAYQPEEIARTVKKLKPQFVAIAYDQDKREKAQVQAAEKEMLKLIASTIPAVKLFVLEWDGTPAKGIDDAIKAGLTFKWQPAGPRLVTGLPGSLVTEFFPPRPVHTLEQSRRWHSQTMTALVTNPTGQKIAFTSPTGTGKSRAADDALAAAALGNNLTGRWLLLAPNKANIAERTQPGTKLNESMQAGHVVIQQGRRLVETSEAYKPTPFDCANPAAFDAGSARHIAAKVVCKDCPFGSATNWEKTYPGQPRTFQCEQSGYLASRRASEKAAIVIATKEAYLNNSDMSDDFTGIICDEDLLQHLYETLNFTSETFAGWREAITLKNLLFPDWEVLVKVIETAFDSLATSPNINEFDGWIPTRPILEQIAESLGQDFDNLVNACYGYERGRENAFGFERDYIHNNKQRFPFKAGFELLEALLDPTNPPQFVRSGSGSYSLTVFAPKTKLVNILRSKTLVILDATIPPALRFYFPGLKEEKYEVAQNLAVFQITDALYSKRDLFNPKVRERVSKAISSFASGKKKHLTIMPQRFEGGAQPLTTPEGSMSQHWGLHKATNQYSDCDGLTLVGHHLRPIDFIKAELLAARSFARIAPPQLSSEDRELKFYNWVATNGTAAARWMKVDLDTDVQAAITHDYEANIIQAIGRLRAACRPSHLPPVQVLILCNEPVGDLPITQLVTVDEVITYPPKNDVSIVNTIMEVDKNGGLVPVYSDIQEGRAETNEELDQDETRQTQVIADIWGDFEDLEDFDYPLRQ